MGRSVALFEGVHPQVVRRGGEDFKGRRESTGEKRRGKVLSKSKSQLTRKCGRVPEAIRRSPLKGD